MKIVQLLVLLLSFTFSTNTFAQAENDDYVVNHKNDILVVVGGGLAGAILGLSTLSFVEEPKEHTNNIFVGASLGIVAGVAFVAFNQANQSKQLIRGSYEEDAMYKSSKEFNTFARNDWHMDEVIDHSSMINSANQVNYNFKF